MILFNRNFPNGVSEANVHLYCYRNWVEGCPKSKAFHMEQAIRLLWPETLSSGKKGYIWSDWAYRRLESWCANEFQTWWGPSSSGKSTDAGVLCLTHWLSAPDCTTVIVCSTTKDMLERRIWREIVRFHSMYRGKLPGKLRKTPLGITLEAADSVEGENTINGLFAIAIQKGTTAEAVGNIIGIHNDYNVLIIDEMQATKQAAVEAYDNLSTGKESKFLGMGNPVSRLDPLGIASEPIKGWNSVNPEMESWKTKKGVTLYFDGLKSPAITEPNKFFFLLNKAQIESMAIDPGRDSPRFWSQRRGFVPPEGLTETVLTESFIQRFNMTKTAKWVDRYDMVFGLDPSFSGGGDRCVLVPAKVGDAIITPDSGIPYTVKLVEFCEPINIELKITTGEPLTFYLAGEVTNKLEQFGAKIDQLAIDTTGSQRTLSDIIDRQNNDGLCCHRVNFGEKASELPAGSEDHVPSNQIYKDKVTELWFMVREFGKNQQIRGLSNQAAKEFCQRECDPRMDTRNLLRVESKREMKKRTGGKSPDTADACVCVLDFVRFRLGIHPGDGKNNKSLFFKQQEIDTWEKAEETNYDENQMNQWEIMV